MIPHEGRAALTHQDNLPALNWFVIHEKGGAHRTLIKSPNPQFSLSSSSSKTQVRTGFGLLLFSSLLFLPFSYLPLLIHELNELSLNHSRQLHLKEKDSLKLPRSHARRKTQHAHASPQTTHAALKTRRTLPSSLIQREPCAMQVSIIELNLQCDFFVVS